MNSGEIEKLIEKLGDRMACEEAILHLVQIGKPAVPALIGALGHKYWRLRRMAVIALGKIGDASAIPALSKALENEYGEGRWEVVAALEKIGLPAVPALIEALGVVDATSKAADALWEIGPRNSADLRLVANAARKARKEGKTINGYWRVYFAWSKRLNEQANAIINNKSFHVPRIEKPDGVERVLRVKRAV